MRNRHRSLFFILVGCLPCAFGGSGRAQTIDPFNASAQAGNTLLPPAAVEEPAPDGKGAARSRDAAADMTPEPQLLAPDDDNVLRPSWVNDLVLEPTFESDARGAGALDSDPDPVDETRLAPLVANTQKGATGLARVLSADPLRVGDLALQVGGQFSHGRDVIVRGDRNTHLGGVGAVAYGLLPHLELFGSLSSFSNRNRRVCMGGICDSEAGRSDPEIIRTFGDLMVGAKWANRRKGASRLALYGSLHFRPSRESLLLDLDATSIAVGALGSWDLSQYQAGPIRFHVNLGYLVDNSSNLNNSSGTSLSSQLVTDYAYRSGRSRFQTAAAVELVPAKVSKNVRLSPFAEYHLELVTGRGDLDFADFTRPRCSQMGMVCKDNRDQHWVTAGLRGEWFKHWSATAAFDLWIRTVGFPYGPPQPPWSFLFQLGRAFDLGRQRSSVVAGSEDGLGTTMRARSNKGVIAGRVVKSTERVPLASAIVSVVGRPRAKVATDADGTFTSHELEPGMYTLNVVAPGYAPRTVHAQVSSGIATDIEVTLSLQVKTMARGRVADVLGKAVVGEVRFEGASRGVAYTDASGNYEVELAPGIYVARVEAEGHLTKEQRLLVEAGDTVETNFTVRPQPQVATVEWLGGSGGLIVRSPVTFQAPPGGLPTVLNPQSLQALDEIVDLLVKQPRVRRLVIETHWDAGVGKVDALALTEQQAEAIAQYLQQQGIAADRLELAPRGASSPVVPGDRKGRQHNRRVNFTVIAG